MRRLAVLLLGALFATGCGGGDDDRPQVPEGDALTVYTSLPRHGDSASAAAAVLEGQRLALADRGGRAAGRPVKLVALDAAKPGERTWDPGVVEQNAGRAADDPAAVAYLGEFDHGGSALSVPVTNDTGLAQISPMDGLTGLTQVQPGGPRGGPERFYPSDARTFARLVPTDLSQATALVDWARERGAKRIAVVHDDHLHGRSLAAQAVFVADARKLPVIAVKEVEAGDDPAAYRDAAVALAEEDERPDAVVYAGVAGTTGGPLLAEVGRALPRAGLYAVGFAPDQELEGVGTVRFVATTRPASDYPPAARRVLDRLARARRGGAAPVAAIYGYESMRLTLAAINRAGADGISREAVAREAVRAGPRPGSVLGDLAFTASGDVADQRVAAFRREGARVVFEGLRVPRPPALPAAPGDPGDPGS